LELLIPIALVLAGLALIVAEVYLVPGFNIVGILGLVLIVFAVGYTFTESGLLGGMLTLVGTVVAGGSMFWFMWQSGAWDRFVLSTNLRQDEKVAASETEQRTRFLGREGTALTPLRPTGVVEIGDERLEVMTEGEFIAAGSRIRIVAMDRRRYFVRLAEVVVREDVART
jgi:membrane-bound serine protease (ClpP class)